MKKKLIVSFIVVAVLIGAAILILPFKLYDLITVYEPYTFDRVYDDEGLRGKYGIGSKRTPKDYGFQPEEVNIKSIYDSLNLHTWYVENDRGLHKSIVLVHGRTSNKLKTMKYLDLIRDAGLDTLYNVFIPDLRNSGKSEKSKTLMGYKFAEDLAACLIFLKKEKQQDTLILYGFSMGAMAILTALNREDLSDSLDKHHVCIDKLIFDSPLSNVYETLFHNANELGVPKIMFDQTFKLMERETNQFAANMKMSYLLNNLDYPLLIFQSKSDKTTPYAIFRKEYDQIQKNHVQLYLYDSVDHVQTYQNEKYKQTYTERVRDFIMSGE